MKLIILFLPMFLFSYSLKIASYNVENLFDMRKSGLEYPDYTPNHHNWTKAMLQKKINNLSKVICEINPDVIGLQEIENDYILAKLQKKLARVGCKYRYRAITNTKNTTIHNAMLSKVKIKHKKDVLIYKRGRHRSILEIDLDTVPPLKIFVNHWRSKKGPESGRIHYAKAMMRRISKLRKGSEYIVLGDFNSNYNEYKIISKKRDDRNGITGINNIMKTVKNDKLIELDALPRVGNYHYNLWLELPKYERWSHNFYGKKEGLDAMLIPYTMHNKIAWEYVKDSFSVFKPKYLFGYKGSINRWQYKYGKHRGKGYSDHLPIYAIFRNSMDKRATIGTDGFWSSIKSLFTTEKEDTIDPAPPTIDIKNAKIKDIYSMERINSPIILKSIKVIFKRANIAIIKQKLHGRAVLLYRCVDDLEEGYEYDIEVSRKKVYKGLDEIVGLSIIKNSKPINISKYMLSFENRMIGNDDYVNEVVANVDGVYRDRNMEVDGKKIPIYFKNHMQTPKDGQAIRLKKVQIGYYKNHMQFVVWDKKDYEIKE